MKVEDFYEHIGTCEACYGEEDSDWFSFCEIGKEMLYEVANELPESWRPVIERQNRQDRLEREADEQFRYYADCGDI